VARKAISEKTKKKIYQECGMACPMCGEDNINTFEIHHIQPYADSRNHDEGNLILLCSSCHAKVTTGEINENEVLRLKIALLNGKHQILNKAKEGNTVNFSDSVNNGVVANNVEIKTQHKLVKLNAPQGTIASSINHRNYIKRLIDRYHEFKVADVGKENMKYTILYGAITKEFGAKWDMVPLEKFDKLTEFLHKRIDNTILGKQKIKECQALFNIQRVSC